MTTDVQCMKFDHRCGWLLLPMVLWLSALLQATPQPHTPTNQSGRQPPPTPTNQAGSHPPATHTHQPNRQAATPQTNQPGRQPPPRHTHQPTNQAGRQPPPSHTPTNQPGRQPPPTPTNQAGSHPSATHTNQPTRQAGTDHNRGDPPAHQPDNPTSQQAGSHSHPLCAAAPRCTWAPSWRARTTGSRTAGSTGRYRTACPGQTGGRARCGCSEGGSWGPRSCQGHHSWCVCGGGYGSRV